MTTISLLLALALATTIHAFAPVVVPQHNRLRESSSLVPRHLWHFSKNSHDDENDEDSGITMQIQEDEISSMGEDEDEVEEEITSQEEEEDEGDEDDSDVEEKAEEIPIALVVPNGDAKPAANGHSAPAESVDSEEEIDEQDARDEKYMQMAIDLVLKTGGESSPDSSFPNPTTGAVLVAEDGRVLGKAVSDYCQDSVSAALADAGIDAVPLQEWCVTWPASRALRNDMHKATLYTTMEPSHKRRGQMLPPITQLVDLCGIARVVIGSPNPIAELASKGASALHASGVDAMILDGKISEDCLGITSKFTQLADSKLQRMARTHQQRTGRPLGFLHCSVVNSDNLEAFARAGNAFGKSYNGKSLSYRSLGAYEIAPPPEVIWASDDAEPYNSIPQLEFEDEELQESLNDSPVMPWYEQVDAVVATFPKSGQGLVDGDDSVRMNGLKWMATYGNELPAGVERILVLDATDIFDLPLTNADPNAPAKVDVEAFWTGKGRKPTRILLRKGDSALAQSAAEAAAKAAEGAAKAALAAKNAVETGDAESAAEAAMECAQAAADATRIAQEELMASLERKRKLQEMGVIVETLSGSEPIDIMNHLGARNGYDSVVWRAGCWGNRGVDAILDGAFQWVSAHLAVDAQGGKFWQLMLAERAVQAACGPESRVKVFAGAEDFSLEYCDQPGADSDCALTVDGKPIRHVRLDCRVALVDAMRPREFVTAKTKLLDRQHFEEKAPWFL